MEIPNLFSLSQLKYMGVYLGIHQGLLSPQLMWIFPNFFEISLITNSSDSDSTLNSKISSCIAYSMSTGDLPTPENTILFELHLQVKLFLIHHLKLYPSLSLR